MFRMKVNKMEVWKVVDGFKDYSVSSMGHVKRTTYGRGLARAGRVLKLRLTKDGYLYVSLYGSKKLRVHRMVAKAFVSNPKHKPEVHHRDKKKTHNIPRNLMWVTRSEHEKLEKKSWHLSGRGVHFIARLGKWAAQYQRIWLGCFSTKKEALRAREVAINAKFTVAA